MMKRIMNICLHYSDFERYESRDDLRSYYQSFGLDGLEVLDKCLSGQADALSAPPHRHRLMSGENVLRV